MYTEPKGQVDLEKQLMAMLLDGDDHVLEELRNQYQNSVVESRKFSGAGFFTNFKVKSEIPPITTKKNFELGDIIADFNNVKYAMGFMLFVRNGYLDWLEGYTMTINFWPEDYSGIKLYYTENKRDLVDLRNHWEK